MGNLEFQEMKPVNMKQHWFYVLAVMKRWWTHVLLNMYRCLLDTGCCNCRLQNVCNHAGMDTPPPSGGPVAISPLNIQTQTCFYSISSRSIKHPKVRNGDEFQQRGQKKSANSLQMFFFFCFFSRLREHDVALADEKKKDSTAGESSMNYEQKRPSTAFFFFCLFAFPKKEKGVTCMQTHIYPSHKQEKGGLIVFTLWRTHMQKTQLLFNPSGTSFKPLAVL